MPRVLFVSKPIAAPFHDGTKCLVRDVAMNLTRFEPVVLSTEAGPGFGGGERVRSVPVYRSSGAFTPRRTENARAALYLFTGARADVWHFVFAPNPVTSHVGRVARSVRRVPVVQTVASPPREFRGAIFFGDVIVAQSRWTRQRVLGATAGKRRVEVVPPPVAALPAREPEEVRHARRVLGVPDGAPMFVYPGDLEAGSAADAMAGIVEPLARAVPGAVVVFACRAKTPRAPEIQRALERRLTAERVRFAGEGTNLPNLMASAAAVLFPVDDLFGKVDLPISLLEAMQLGVPVVSYDWGPLADLEGALLVPSHDAAELVRGAAGVALDTGQRQAVVSAQKEAVARRFSAARVAAAYERIYSEIVTRAPGMLG